MSRTTFRDLIYDPSLGGGIPGGKTLRAFIPGGVSAPWFGPDQLDLGLNQDAVGQAGSMLGSGSVVVMDSDTCPVRAAWRIAQFFHRESCGQCTPCSLAALARLQPPRAQVDGIVHGGSGIAVQQFEARIQRFQVARERLLFADLPVEGEKRGAVLHLMS